MPTMAALEGYINDTSSALFSLAALIAGQTSEEIEHLARHAGLAQGITPGDGVAAAGCFAASIVRTTAGTAEPRLRIEEVFAGKETRKLRAAFDQLLGEAKGI